jgi:hypothetical protein
MFDARRVFHRTQRPTAAAVLTIAFILPCASVASADPGDIVLYASDIAIMRGAWERVSSTTGAGGQLMRSPDAGWSTASAFAAPQNYFEASFDAPANTVYHVWLRLRAASNARYSDSVWVQMSDALTPSGIPVWRTGSTSALLVNLEACSGCGVSGWGWADSAWWTGAYPVVKFSTTGRHTIRVQTREDGVQIDQIVLSPTAYFNVAPGGPKDDTTIVAKQVSSGTSPPAEVVLYASEATRRSGNWLLETDGTAALGKRNGSYNYGWDSKSAPAATPADFLEWTFRAVAGVRYRTWLRLSAAGQSIANDSVWVQFAGSVDASGRPKYGIGTLSALAVGLENCSGCGVSGWGWQRRAWWTPDTGDVYFATTGVKTIRVQTREDGVRVDQIVLSPSKFLSAAPGPLRDDRTLVNRDGTTSVIGSGTSLPTTVTFTPSVDHVLVISYRFEVFTAGSNLSNVQPVRILALGKPPIVSGQIRADVSAAIQVLPAGSYIATVTAVGAAGSSRSAPSNTFIR